MKKRLYFNSNKALVGVTKCADQGISTTHSNGYTLQEVEIYESSIIYGNPNAYYPTLYRVDFEENLSFWIYASCDGSALAEALLLLGNQKEKYHPVRLQWYLCELYEEIPPNKNFEEIDTGISSCNNRLIKDLISVLNERNKDLVALAMNNVIGYETEFDIKHADRMSFSYTERMFDVETLDDYIDSADAERIRKIFSHMWYNYWVDYPISIYALLNECRSCEEPEKLLFWSFVFCLWTGYEISGTRWALYKRVMNGSFEPLLNEYHRIRPELEKHKCD